METLKKAWSALPPFGRVAIVVLAVALLGYLVFGVGGLVLGVLTAARHAAGRYAARNDLKKQFKKIDREVERDVVDIRRDEVRDVELLEDQAAARVENPTDADLARLQAKFGRLVGSLEKLPPPK